MIIKVKHWSFLKTLRVRRRSRNELIESKDTLPTVLTGVSVFFCKI